MAKCVIPEIDSEINSSNESDEIDFKSGIISVNVESVGVVCNRVIIYWILSIIPEFVCYINPPLELTVVFYVRVF